ncbi:MAG: TonB-dependent receptor [Nevskia sp.]|nr:TonB-dependent receptor [Nevskia sp.]
MALPAAARAEVQVAGGDLTALSLDQLMSIEVTSVSKHAQSLADAAAAVYVLTGDDIRRSGAHSIAEALRQVPGLEVAQVSAQQYAITARGFNSTSADKLQVLLDGRSVYTPLTSGVFWDVLDTDLADIDRIEVIRGPGAALWGANAVNGVINIITRSARDTTGVAARAAGGNIERAYGAARWGFDAGAGAVRLYAQGNEVASSAQPDGQDAIDGMRLEQLGFRSDWDLPHTQTLTVSGDAYTGRERAAGLSGGPTDTTVTGGNVVGRWGGRSDGGSNWSLLGYYDGYARDIPGIYAETRNTYDLEFQQDFRLGNNLLLYGVGYRNSHDDTAAPPSVIPFLPSRLTLQTGNTFVQDQIDLGPVSVTLGTKFETSTYTHFEFEPSLRLGWHVAEPVFLWAAASRAVRTPNRLDEDLAIFCPPPNGFPGTCGPGLFRIGNPELKSTRLLAYEAGLRWVPAGGVSVDLATFYNNYSDVLSTETTPPPFRYANKLTAHSYGGELSLAWRPWSWASVRPYYQLLRIDASAAGDSTDTSSVAALEGSDPRHGAGLLLGVEPAPGWQADLDLRYVDKLPALQVPDYAEMNLRLAWKLAPRLELALSGRNLLDSRHTEWGLPASRIEPRRSGLLELSWGLY